MSARLEWRIINEFGVIVDEGTADARSSQDRTIEPKDKIVLEQSGNVVVCLTKWQYIPTVETLERPTVPADVIIFKNPPFFHVYYVGEWTKEQELHHLVQADNADQAKVMFQGAFAQLYPGKWVRINRVEADKA